MSCSCQCGHVWDVPGDMWWCMDCINVVLTTKCKDEVKDPKFVTIVCHESHDHLYIPKWNEEKMKTVPEDHVPWSDEVIEMKKWKSKITKTYNLAK